ncbi:unnamed protein product [Moneuplotes crassus]|uniref:USP domain-containing protein n=2 Tax=Euplotes crassus TaxID=5936 RepID=A0AAD1UMC6_EUPCR|nr:unnamed protein product [Moneuplotes crassus]
MEDIFNFVFGFVIIYSVYKLICLFVSTVRFCCRLVCCCRNNRGLEGCHGRRGMDSVDVGNLCFEFDCKREDEVDGVLGSEVISDTKSEKEEIKENKEEAIDLKIYKGIRSPDLDSFLTSALQCLISIPEFCSPQENEEMKDFRDCKLNPQTSVLDEIKDLKRRYFDDYYEEIDIMNIRRSFNKKFPRFQNHDSFDLLMALFEDIQKQMNPTMAPFIPNSSLNYKDICKEYENSHPSIVNQLFVGLSKLTYVCQDCGKENIIYDDFKHITLDCIHQSSKLAFKELCESFNRGKYSHFRCKKCQCDSLCMFTNKIIKYPKYLLIVIQKEELKCQSQSNKPIDYKSSFSLPTPDSQTVTYTLKSIICKTRALLYNHYSAICKRGSEWVLFDNSFCSTITETFDLTLRSDVHILFYKAEEIPEF